MDQSISIDGSVLQGSAYTSLGTLYYQVPGWPIGFGDDEKAEELLEQARAELRACVPFYDKDRYFAADIEKANNLLALAVHNDLMPVGLLPSC